METREFLDLIYSHWAKTTGSSDCFWMPEEDSQAIGFPWDIYAVDEKQEKKLLASFMSSEDADFITAIHGCLPDLVRQLHEALDEADRLDEERDRQEQRIFNLELQVDDLRGLLEDR